MPFSKIKSNTKMTFYQKELSRIKADIYSNQAQIETVIGIRNYIDRNYADDLNLNHLAQILFMSKYHFTIIQAILWTNPQTIFDRQTNCKSENAATNRPVRNGDLFCGGL